MRPHKIFALIFIAHLFVFSLAWGGEANQVSGFSMRSSAQGGIKLSLAELSAFFVAKGSASSTLKITIKPHSGYVWHSCENKPIEARLNWRNKQRAVRFKRADGRVVLTTTFELDDISELNTPLHLTLALAVKLTQPTNADKPEYLFEEANIDLKLIMNSAPVFTTELILSEEDHSLIEEGNFNLPKVAETQTGTPLWPSLFLGLATMLALVAVGLGVLRTSRGRKL